MTAANDDLLYEVKDEIGLITLNRPQARNALTFEMYERIAEICANAPTDGSVKVIIMRGAGEKAFAAGTDISLFKDFSSPEQGIAYENIDAALAVPQSDLRLFGKPEAFSRRRMGVALAYDGDIEQARANAKLAASLVKPVSVRP